MKYVPVFLGRVDAGNPTSAQLICQIIWNSDINLSDVASQERDSKAADQPGQNKVHGHIKHTKTHLVEGFCHSGTRWRKWHHTEALWV